MTLTEFIEVELPLIEECSETIPKEIAEVGAEIVLGFMDIRIFEKGIASDNEPIAAIIQAQTSFQGGEYSEGHGKKRQQAGRQTSFIDLELEGDLALSLAVGISESGTVSVGFLNQQAGLLATYHEEYRQKEIFTPAEEEIEQLIEFFNGEIPILINKCLESKP